MNFRTIFFCASEVCPAEVFGGESLDAHPTETGADMHDIGLCKEILFSYLTIFADLLKEHENHILTIQLVQISLLLRYMKDAGLVARYTATVFSTVLAVVLALSLGVIVADGWNPPHARECVLAVSAQIQTSLESASFFSAR